METTELRIGNLVYVHRGTHKVTKTIEEVTLSGLVEQDELHDVHFSPIPLTEDWLIKFGFGKSDSEECGHNINEHFGFYYDWHFKRFRMEFSDGANVVDVNMDIHHIHQLQNLFFALTGEELKQV